MTDPRTTQLIDEAMKMRLSRRSVMRRASALGISAGALGGVLAATGHASAKPRAAVYIQQRTMNTLAATYFVPEGQTFFTQVAEDWAGQNNVTITTDYIGWPDLQPRIAAAVEGGSGPDVIEMWDIWPYLYQEKMVPVQDLAEKVSEQYGGFYDWVTKTASVDGQWYSVPHGSSSSAFAYRISLLEEAGIDDPKNNFPKTWDELFALGKTLKEMGKPIGQALGQSLGDPPSFAYPYMWCYGGMEVEEDGTTPAINKPEFVDALQAFTQTWKDAFDETGLSWDDGANNRAFLSDQISMTLNGSSVYLAAVAAKAGESKLDYEVQVDPDDIWHAGYPDWRQIRIDGGSPVWVPVAVLSTAARSGPDLAPPPTATPAPAPPTAVVIVERVVVTAVPCTAPTYTARLDTIVDGIPIGYVIGESCVSQTEAAARAATLRDQAEATYRATHSPTPTPKK